MTVGQGSNEKRPGVARSNIVRLKSEARKSVPQKLLDTIVKANAQRDLYIEESAKSRGWRIFKGALQSGSLEELGNTYDVDRMNMMFSVIMLGSKAMIAWERPDGAAEERLRFIQESSFRTYFKNLFTEIQQHDGKVRRVTWADAWLIDPHRRSYEGLEFYPDPKNAVGTYGYLNLWRGFAYEPTETGSWSIFRDHLLNHVCGGSGSAFNWLFGWMAEIFQRPRDKSGTAIALKGPQGAGKSVVGEHVGRLLGLSYMAVDDPRYIVGNFNSHMASCLLLQAEEAFWAGDKHAEGRLKGLITSKVQMIEQKGLDPVKLANHIRVMFTSNDDWVLPAAKDERRFAVFEVGADVAKNHQYFAEMADQLAAGGYGRLLHDLLTFDLSQVNLRDIPKNAALIDQKLRSLDPIDAWWHERLREGAATRKIDHWPKWITTRNLFDDYCGESDRVGIKRKSRETSFSMRLKKLLPGVARRQGYAEDEGQRRAWGYELPSLHECRELFNRALEQDHDWQ